MSDVRFYNFDENNMAAIGTCSHCSNWRSTDSGARTVETECLYFDDLSVTRRIRYGYPEKAIIHEMDGSLTNLVYSVASPYGAGSWATPNLIHNRQASECDVSGTLHDDGLLCHNTVQVRRLAFYGYTPNIFYGQVLRITQYDDTTPAYANSQTIHQYLAELYGLMDNEAND
jgi:hypothetical protein